MEVLIKSFPDQLFQAIEIGKKVDCGPKTDFSNVVLLGMGGSAFGAEVLRNLSSQSCKIPFLILRDYHLPAFIDKNSLVIVSSYSGNTEETLAASKEAQSKGCRMIFISSGGEIARQASEMGAVIFPLPPGIPPRAAAGYSIVQLLYVFRHFGFINDFENDLAESIDNLRKFNPPIQPQWVAGKLKGKLPFIYSTPDYESAAIRWRQQIEENAKQIASHHVVPEMNHNELVGWKLPEALIPSCCAVFLECEDDHERNRYRMNLNLEIIRKAGAEAILIKAEGKSKLARLLFLIHFGDWVSVFLAKENNIDPTPVQVIDFLKSELSRA